MRLRRLVRRRATAGNGEQPGIARARAARVAVDRVDDEVGKTIATGWIGEIQQLVDVIQPSCGYGEGNYIQCVGAARTGCSRRSRVVK